MSRLRDFRFVAFGALLALLPACALKDVIVVEKPPPRVAVKAYPIDLAYGTEPPPEPGTPEAFAAIATTMADFSFFEPDFGAGITTRPGPPPGPCPAAGPDVFPAEPAPLDVAAGTTVTEGRYRWRQSGTYELANLFKLPLAGDVNRTIAGLQVAGGNSYTFDTDSSTPAGRKILRLRVTPGAGIDLIKLTRFTSQGPREFNPVPPMRIFPLPASPGLAISAVGIDPVSLQTLNVAGRVKGRDRVDACGDVFEGWRAETTWTLQNVNSTTQAAPTTYNYTVGTGFGGMFLSDYEKVPTGTNEAGLTYSLEVTSTINAVKPVGA